MVDKTCKMVTNTYSKNYLKNYFIYFVNNLQFANCELRFKKFTKRELLGAFRLSGESRNIDLPFIDLGIFVQFGENFNH